MHLSDVKLAILLLQPVDIIGMYHHSALAHDFKVKFVAFEAAFAFFSFYYQKAHS
jgi:hypothetical protein